MPEMLNEVETGQEFMIEEVPDLDLRTRLLRLGFLDGTVRCRYSLRKGPVIISRNGTDLAIGDVEAEKVRVSGSD